MPQLGWLKEAVRPYYLRWLYFPLRPGQRPHAFRDCWHYPYHRIDGDSSRLPESPSGTPDLLFYPMTDWHTRIQRTQHLARAFAGLGFRCIYINPHLGREFESSPLFDKSHRLSQLDKNIFELHIRLPREPVFHERLLTAAEEDVIASVIRRVLPPNGATIQMLSFPLWHHIARRFRDESGFPIVYDCHDLLSGFQKVSPELIALENDLLRDAGLVLFSSQGLVDSYGRTARKWLLVRNAVTADEFQRASAAAAAAGPPTAGYVGALDSWFDVEAVREAAARNPQCRFLLAGRVEYQPIRRLAMLSNVELAGEVPYKRVPELMASFRVALIPFHLTPLTLMTNPIKLYEYFSRGLPVVSTPLPEAQAMGDLVYIAGGPDDFARQVTLALAEDDPALRARRQEIAESESWTARVREISVEFGALMARAEAPR